KDVEVTIPKNQITVITGVSGSGKSSLAFDTIYEEGKRRYFENHNEDLITIQDHANTARKSFNKTHQSDFSFYSDIERKRLIS
ncbi:ATP-binding cassette domain-containing protein, partial [Clostridioides difficile]|uniref:ATP-binding cassette domain-containing protein n=1 Tax=Clostridioides difficile TaxID=1496 RepID=UPI00155ADD6E